MNETLVGFVVSLAVGVGASIFLRYVPKAKAISAGDKHGEFLGILVSNIGNSKLGKKIWNKIEEGPIVTGLAYLMSLCVSFGKNLLKDNEIKED